MPAADVLIQEVGMGRHIVTVNGVRLSGVRAVTVAKRVGDMDLITVELLSQRTTVLPADLAPTLADLEARDADIDARTTPSTT